MIPPELQERNDVLFQKLVPSSGVCETLEGELLRSLNRLCYRWYNDGDYWYESYGCITAGPAESFLRRHSPKEIRDKLSQVLSRSDGKREDEYEKCLLELVETVVSYVEGRGENTVLNFTDMLDLASKYAPRTTTESP